MITKHRTINTRIRWIYVRQPLNKKTKKSVQWQEIKRLHSSPEELKQIYHLIDVGKDAETLLNQGRYELVNNCGLLLQRISFCVVHQCCANTRVSSVDPLFDFWTFRQFRCRGTQILLQLTSKSGLDFSRRRLPNFVGSVPLLQSAKLSKRKGE